MNRPPALALALALLAGPPSAPAAPALKDGKNDLKKLDGEWKVESWVQLGRPIPMTATWSFTGDKYALDMGTNREEGTIALGQAKTPATIDLAITGGGCAGKDQPGIYKFDGDTLIFCFAWPGVAERPTDFASTAENRWILITLKRAK
jgi:uncharacterized protein (TIGR03067 family)